MQKSIVIIGSSNIDISGFPQQHLIKNDSSPGSITISAGGVARNIAENISRLGVKPTFISALGSDLFGKYLKNNAKEINIDIKHCIIHKYKPTSAYMLIANDMGNVEQAISDTNIIEEVSPDFIRSKTDVINKHKIIVIDTNLSVETISHIVENFDKLPIFIDLVSTTKAVKVKKNIGKFHTVKANVQEAEALSGTKYKTENDLLKFMDFFLNKGVNQLFISMGSKGSFYANHQINGIIEGVKVDVVNSSGAGDAFISGLVYCYLQKMSVIETARFAAACSLITLQTEKAVNPEISVELVNEYILKYAI